MRNICCIALTVLLVSGTTAYALKGVCSNCHTMHNSQNNQSMLFEADLDDKPNLALTRGGCVGCHAQDTGYNIFTIGESEIPQVLHTAGTDLAAGNYKYLTSKGDNYGHNVVDIDEGDDDLYGPPGAIVQYGHEDGEFVNEDDLTCAGANGCHGTRSYSGPSGLAALSGAHHGNADGKLTTADTIANSYRFLDGVYGLENPTDKWQNLSAASHNEYLGAITPQKLGCSGGEICCHEGSPYAGGKVLSKSHTISEFCGTCHGNFHTLETYSSDGVGSDTDSPFIRHPTDVKLPGAGTEYNSYTTFNVEAPVGRTTLPDNPSSTVDPAAGGEVVTCLSCHMAHASQYSNMLRWDYEADCVTGTTGTGCGCFVCHTEKDD